LAITIGAGDVVQVLDMNAPKSSEAAVNATEAVEGADWPLQARPHSVAEKNL